jgi:hypothetical protein
MPSRLAMSAMSAMPTASSPQRYATFSVAQDIFGTARSCEA